MSEETVKGRLQRGWDKSGVGAYAALAMLLALVLGYAVAGWQAQKNMAVIVEQHRLEREQIKKSDKTQLDYLRRQLRERNATVARQSDQLAKLGEKGVDAAKKSSELGQQILEGSVK